MNPVVAARPLLLLALLSGCAPDAAPEGDAAGPGSLPGPAGFRFVDASAGSGLDRVTWAGRPGKDHLLDSAGTGLAFLDYDADGRLDLYVVNGWRLDGDRVLERGRHALYRGLGDGRFEDVTEAAGVGGDGRWGCGVCVADQDGDGLADLLVTTFGSLLLYRNRGDGTFEELAGRLGLVSPGWNTGAAFLDAEGDGDLDLYVAAYIACDEADVLAARRTQDWKGLALVAPGPFGMTGAADRYFRCGPDGRYEDATEEAGLVDKALGFGFAVRALDYDVDGDPDLYVANDSDPNYLYRNDGGRFTEVGLWSGAAFDGAGAAQASMGLAVGDVDDDGRPDLFATHFAEDASTLWLARAAGLYEDATVRLGLKQPTWKALSWGAALADLDADGDLDLVIADGHIYPQVDEHPAAGHAYRQRPLLLEHDGGVFRDASDRAGPAFATAWPARGLAVGDVDGDGDLDIAMTQLDGPPILLRNETAGGAWLTVLPTAAPGSGPVLGTRVLVTAGGRTQSRDVSGSDSYLGAHDPRLHFGLGAHEVAEEVVVVWPDGTRTTRHDVPARRLLTFRRGD